MILLVGLCLVCWLEPRSSADAQQGESKPVQNPKEEPQTIRLGTQLVNVFFSVTDKKNQYINDLSKNEVMVLENGRPQQIFTFKHEVDLPLTVAILVDISNSVRSIIPRLTSASSKFLNSVMRPEIDTSALIQFDSEATLIEDLTSNLGRLSGSLQELEHSLSLPPKREGILPPPVTAGSRRGGTAIYDAVVAVSQDLLAPRKGRKTIILFTDGQDTTSFTKREEAVDLAIHTETIIYAIGIGQESDETVNKKDLNKLCEQTGGRAYIPKTVQDLDRAFAQLEQELRQQYLLAYEPANDHADGSFRRIEVRLRNRKDLAVHHRPGYYAVKP
ncbi:MAG TPA: VWA domain-containing protein [Blastocatellia bacterium]|nr:VWA domain-containing protein [Blastocatellia bacterium]